MSENLSRAQLRIRPAAESDVPIILRFIHELATYERAPESAVARPDDLVRDGFRENPKFRVAIAEWEGEPAGFALFFYNYSTWQGRPGIYLEDLFVRPAFRHKGIGKALLRHLASIAAEENCGRLQWQVLDWNAPAIEFYRSLGAEAMPEWVTMRLEGGPLTRLGETE